MASKNYSMIEFQILRDDTDFTYSTKLVILYALRGSINVHMADSAYILREEGMCVLPVYSLYRVTCHSGGAALAMTISRELLSAAGTREEQFSGTMIEPTDQDRSAVDLRRHCADLFLMKSGKRPESEVSAEAIALLSNLKERCGESKSGNRAADEKNLQRLKNVLDLVNRNWRDRLELSGIAAEQHLSAGYLSRVIHQYTGRTFTDYRMSVRLEHAAEDVLNTKKTISEIAGENGFGSSSIFIAAFKNKYHSTPAHFRETFAETIVSAPGPETSPSEWMEALLKYASETADNHATESVTVNADAAAEGKVTPKPWKKILNIGYAHDGLIGEVQRQIQRACREIGFEYIRFHGIFDDDMHLLQDTGNDSVTCDFTYVDLLFDFIVREGLRPYVEFSYIPDALAKREWHAFERCSNVSPVTDIKLWESLITMILQHWFTRYGEKEVKRWLFTTVAGNFIFVADKQYPFGVEEYLELYFASWEAVKSTDPELRFGAPSFFCDLLLDEAKGEMILKRIFEQGCKPDLFPLQCYQQETSSDDQDFILNTFSQMSSPSIISPDEDYTLHSITKFKAWLNDQGICGKPVIVEEWNSTLWQRDLSGDTLFKACWIVRNAIRCADEVDALGYWLLTDLIEERNKKNSIFHGGYGLMCSNGVPKAGYPALMLLDQAGSYQIESGDNWAVFRNSRNDLQIFLWNYCHYDGMYRHRYRKLEKPEEAYKVFENGGDKKFRVIVHSLDGGRYHVSTSKLTRQQGSSYDRWLAIGAPDSITTEEADYLNEACVPLRTDQMIQKQSSWEYSCELKPHEVMMMRVKKKI